MRSMTRMAVAGCMALAALSAVAVLDVGSSTAEAAPSVSPFAGSWSGTYSAPGLGGTIDWTISDTGQLTGTFYNYVYGGGTVDGHVSAHGNLVLYFRKPDFFSSGWPFQGTAVIAGAGDLVATYTNPWPAGQGGYTEVATLTRK